MSIIERDLTINGLHIHARFERELIEERLIPEIIAHHRAKTANGERSARSIVFIAAPPATGKSTLAAFLADELTNMEQPAQAVGIDGFHFPNAYLREHAVVRHGGTIPLSRIKGAPETYDSTALLDTLRATATTDTAWPGYSRRLHEGVPNALPTPGVITIVEGNWLLLESAPWRHMSDYADLTIFITALRETLRQRLIHRKVQGGLALDQATEFVEFSDLPNVDTVLHHSMTDRADIHLTMSNDGSIG